MIAASFAFGTTQTFQTEVDAYKNYPQIVIALKNAYHKFLKEGIAPIAASGEFGAPLGAGSPRARPARRRAAPAAARRSTGDNNADNTSVGDSNGMSLPAVLERGHLGDRRLLVPVRPERRRRRRPIRSTASFPIRLGPILLFGSSLTIGGTGTSHHRRWRRRRRRRRRHARPPASTPMPSCSRRPISTIYANRIVGSVNRSNTTDFAAPALNVPTFRRTVHQHRPAARRPPAPARP